MPIPVYLSDAGIPVRSVTSGAPELQVSPDGSGIPVRLADYGTPFVVLGAGSATVPAQFGSGDWSVAAGSNPNEITLTISALPDDGGSAITALEYNVGAGWVALSGTGTGARTLTMAAPGTAYTFQIRAVNAEGAGTASAGKTATSGAEPQISDFYGTGPGQVPMRLQSSTAVLSGANVQRVPNAGGASTAFDLIAGTAAITLAGNALDLAQDEWLRFSNVVQTSAPDMMGTTVFIVADVTLGAVDQYFLGNGSPQANVWLTANGAVMRFNRRNPTTNTVEQINVNLSPVVSTGLRIYEIEFLPGVPASNGQTSGGSINVRVNGVLRGTAAHPYPEFRTWNFAAGQNPANGNGLVAKVSDIVSLIQGGDYATRVPIIRQRLNDIYSVGL
ncbi:structural protein [Paracoccus phage vB_PmaP_KLEP18-1]|nr:structural protein [Paracoccus phage vB_PmaP_KLEP18-1]